MNCSITFEYSLHSMSALLSVLARYSSLDLLARVRNKKLSSPKDRAMRRVS